MTHKAKLKNFSLVIDMELISSLNILNNILGYKFTNLRDKREGWLDESNALVAKILPIMSGLFTHSNEALFKRANIKSFAEHLQVCKQVPGFDNIKKELVNKNLTEERLGSIMLELMICWCFLKVGKQVVFFDKVSDGIGKKADLLVSSGEKKMFFEAKTILEGDTKKTYDSLFKKISDVIKKKNQKYTEDIKGVTVIDCPSFSSSGILNNETIKKIRKDIKEKLSRQYSKTKAVVIVITYYRSDISYAYDGFISTSLDEEREKDFLFYEKVDEVKGFYGGNRSA